MVEVYWSCLIGGIVFSIISIVAGDAFDHGLDGAGHGIGHGLSDHFDFLNPTTVVSAITTFGGAGILLAEYTPLAHGSTAIIAGAAAISLGIILHFLYVRPMRRSENSVAFSMLDFPGQIGQVTIAIPAHGYGEVMIRIGAGNTNQIAASFDSRPIGAGQQVVVVEVRDGALFVTPIDDGNAELEVPPVKPVASIAE
jgi:membrane protein implicated in regulation of membrane protease activity